MVAKHRTVTMNLWRIRMFKMRERLIIKKGKKLKTGAFHKNKRTKKNYKNVCWVVAEVSFCRLNL